MPGSTILNEPIFIHFRGESKESDKGGEYSRLWSIENIARGNKFSNMKRIIDRNRQRAQTSDESIREPLDMYAPEFVAIPRFYRDKRETLRYQDEKSAKNTI